MALSKAVLQAQIGVFNDTANPSAMPSSAADAGTKWAAAYSTYIQGGAAGGVSPTISPAIESAAAAIITAAIGSNSFSMQAIIDSFFASMIAGVTTVFPGSLSMVGPTVSIDEPTLDSTLRAATTSASANAAIAQAMHDASLTAIVTFPGPVPEDFE